MIGGTFDERLKNEEEITMCSTCQDLYRGVCFYQCGVRATWRPAYNAYLESYSDEGEKGEGVIP